MAGAFAAGLAVGALLGGAVGLVATALVFAGKPASGSTR